MSSAIGHLWRRHVTAHLDAADAAAAEERLASRGGRLEPRAEALVVTLTGALVLTGMSYGVLSRDVQRRLADGLLALCQDVSPQLREALTPYEALLPLATWTLGALFLYLLVPWLVARFALGRSLSDLGLNARGLRHHLTLYAALFAPVLLAVLVVASTPAFQAKYPFYQSPRGLPDLVVWESLYLLQFLALEFFFRGFLVHGTRRQLGSFAAFVPLVPYVMIHFSKPLLETLGAVIAGSVLGLMSLRTGSVAGGVLIHGAVAVSMDMAALAYRGVAW
jgi:membrane protease YdiL (CAAX protease family)